MDGLSTQPPHCRRQSRPSDAHRGDDCRGGGRLAAARRFFRLDFNRELLLWGALLEAALLLFCWLTGVRRGSPGLVWAFLLPAAVWGAAALRVLGHRRPPCTPDCPRLPDCRRGRRVLGDQRGLDENRVVRGRRDPGWAATRWILLGFAALFHLTLLASPQPLSDDLYRYAWDGKLLAHGVNPYAYAPADARLSAWRDLGWERIFNRDVPTGYPPLAEAIFAAAYRAAAYAHGAWTADASPDAAPAAALILRGLAALASLGTAALLMRALFKAGLDERRVLVYAWAPLTALEFANSAHLDAFALFFLAAALTGRLRAPPRLRAPARLQAPSRRGEVLVAACLALGGLVKFYPLLLAPVWGRHWDRRAWATLALVSALGWAPFVLPGVLDGGGSPFTGLGIFALRGDFNGSLYRLIEAAWYALLASPTARIWARLTAAAAPVAVYCAGLWRLRRQASLPAEDTPAVRMTTSGAASTRDAALALDGWRFAGACYGLALLVSPVVHPWYLCALLAFVAIAGDALWLIPAATAIFARGVYVGWEADGVWREPAWTAWAVWAPFYLAWGLRLVRRLGTDRVDYSFKHKVSKEIEGTKV